MRTRGQLLIFLPTEYDQWNGDDESNLLHLGRLLLQMEGKERGLYKPTSVEVSIVLEMAENLRVVIRQAKILH